MNIYVGNLSLGINEDELRQEFVIFGLVKSVIIMNDKDIGSGQAKGYGFVEMPSHTEGKDAMTNLNGKELKNNKIYLIESLPVTDNGDKGSYGSKKHSRRLGRVRSKK